MKPFLEQDKWVSEWLSLTAFLGTADIRVHTVNTMSVDGLEKQGASQPSAAISLT